MPVKGKAGGQGRIRTGRIGAQQGTGGSPSSPIPDPSVGSSTGSNTALGVGSWTTGGGPSPAFQTDFTAISSLPTGVSHSRASNAMQFDSTGKLTYGPNNLLLGSNTFTGGLWTNTNVTLASGQTDPFGGTAATRVTASAGANVYWATSGKSGNFVNSIWIRRATGTGTISLWQPNGGAVTPVTITASWQQFSIAGAADATGLYSGIQISTGGDAVDIYSATCSQVTYETTPRTADQVITTSAAYYGPRFDYAWNGSVWVPNGLLNEEQRTNLFLQTGSPANQTITVVNATSYTVSFYGTGTLTLSGAVAHTITGLGANVRTSYNFTSATTSLVIAVSGSVLYPNVEAGDFATSHIPTTTAAATRSADIVSLTGTPLTALQGASGSVFVEVNEVNPSGDPAYLLSPVGSGDFATAYNTPANPGHVSFYNGAVIDNAAGSGPAVDWTQPVRAGIAWDAISTFYTANGASPTDAGTTAGIGASITAAHLGSASAGASINGHVRSFAVYSSKLSNADLQTKSVVGAAF